jgi:uncharacterized protein (DUF1501 family)
MRKGISRRQLLAVGSMAWLTPVSQLLARAAESAGGRAKSVIILWLAGGPSQLETFDPHPGTMIAGGTGAIKTAAPNIQLASLMPHTAEMMGDISLIRSVVSKEGDHARAAYNMKTGFRPDPTLVHPAIGSVICHQFPNDVLEIPRHVAIMPGLWPPRGGYLGDHLDAFKVFDPKRRVPDVHTRVSEARQAQRLEGLNVVESAFAERRRRDLPGTTLHQDTVQRALKMMSSDQLKAFDIEDATEAERAAYGDTPFGRGCLAALRLIEAGVRCVEVRLPGWDTHINNNSNHERLVGVLDPAFAALVKALKERELLDRTTVMCTGEFGRTPKINPADGRDHWPHGFRVALAGGGIQGGRVLGATDPKGESKEPERPVKVEDVHATVLHTLGIDFEVELETPVGRPMIISEGRVVNELLA